MDKICPQKEIERLINYALDKNLITQHDIIPSRNALMDLLEVKEPYEGNIDIKDINIYDILDSLLDYAYEKGILRKYQYP